MLDIGSIEIFMVLVITLIVVGPARLPEIAKNIGKFVRRTKRTIHNLKQETNFDEHLQNFREEVGIDEFKKELEFVQKPMDELSDEVQEVTENFNKTVKHSPLSNKQAETTDNNADKDEKTLKSKNSKKDEKIKNK